MLLFNDLEFNKIKIENCPVTELQKIGVKIKLG